MKTWQRHLEVERWLALPALATLVLGVWGLGRRQLWRDEHATWWAAALSWSELKQLVSSVDAVLAPYYVLMHGWIRLFGASASALRLPSTLALALCALLVVRLGQRLFGARVGLTAGLLFAATPSVSAYAHEARPYALALLASVASALALLRAIDAPGRGSRWVLYALSVVGMGASHLISLCVLAAHVSWVLALRWQRPLQASWSALAWRFGFALGAALSLVLPLIWIGSQQAAAVSWIRGGWREYLAFPGELFFSTPVALVVIALALFGLWRARAEGVLLAVWAMFPPLFLMATFAQLHLFLTRYLLFTLPAWLVLGALGLCELLRRLPRWGRALVVTALIGLAAYGQEGLRLPLSPGAYDYRAAANAVRRRMQPGDAIAFEGPRGGRKQLRVAFHYHFRKQPSELPRDVFVTHRAQEIGDFAPHTCTDSATCLPADVSRLWLVTTAVHKELFEGVPDERARLFEAQFQVSDVVKVSRIKVVLLTRHESPTAAN